MRLLTALAEVGLVVWFKVIEDIEHHGAVHLDLDGGRPFRHETRQRPALITAKETWGVGVAVLEMAGDVPTVGHHSIAVDQHRHPVLAAEGDFVFVAEADGSAFGRQTLVGQRHQRPPAKRAETALVGAGQFVEHD